MCRAPLLTTLLVVGLVGGSLVVATGNENETPGQRWRQRPLGKLLSQNIGRLIVLRGEADLTPEQRDKVRQVLKSHKSEISKSIDTMVASRRALKAAVSSEPMDESAIHKAADELSDAIGEAAVLAAQVRGELKPIFTPRQRELFQRFQQDSQAAFDKFLEEKRGEE